MVADGTRMSVIDTESVIGWVIVADGTRTSVTDTESVNGRVMVDGFANDKMPTRWGEKCCVPAVAKSIMGTSYHL